MTPFDCKDSFGFSLFVDVRFKLCSVLLIWIKHSLLFRKTIEPPLTTTSPQWPPTATSLQRPFFFLDGYSPYTESCFNLFTMAIFFLDGYSPYTESCFNLSTTATSLQPLFVLADSPYIHSCFNLSTMATSLHFLWPLSSVPVTIVD